MSKVMGVSPLTDTIFYGTIKNDKWVGKKEDVTDEAIKAVFEWFMHKVDNLENGHNCYEIQFGGLPYKLQMIKEKES